MGVSGYGLVVTGMAQSNIIRVDEEGKSVWGELFPAPGVGFPEGVHTNSKGMRVLVEKNEEGVTTSIRVWSEGLVKLVNMSNNITLLRESIDKNNEALTKELKSWVGEGGK